MSNAPRDLCLLAALSACGTAPGSSDTLETDGSESTSAESETGETSGSISDESSTGSTEAEPSAGSDGSDDGSSSSGGSEHDSGSSSGACVPLTCAEQGFDCGTIFDGCGGTEECGSCVEPATCGIFEEHMCGCEETEWVIEHVAFTDDVGSHTSMGVDGNGDIHIAHYDATADDLRYATRDAAGGAWSDELVDSVGDVGQQTAMAIDGSGGIHVTYLNRTAPRGLRYAYKPAGGAWTTEVLSTADDGWGSDVIVDADGVVHISHLRADQQPFYTYGNLGDWTSELVVNPVGGWGEAMETGIGVDAGGEVHMCIGGERLYAHNGTIQWYRLYYAHRSGIGAWTRQVVEGEDDGLYTGYDCDLEIDDAGSVHIVHWDWGNQDLRYARLDNPPLGEWTKELVDGTDSVGTQPSLQVDEYGTLVVSYYDTTNEVLKRARKPLDGEWESMLLTDGQGFDTEGEIGLWSALVAEDSANLHVAYYEGESNDLYYAYLATCPL